MLREGPIQSLPASSKRRRRESGAMLLAVLFMMAIMVIAALAVAPSFVMQAKRDREEEMIHRGTEYARAVKKYYRKFGRYPANIEQLENTNQIRFLRKRYKDPLTKDGEWKQLHYGDIALLLGANGIQGQLGAQGATNGLGGLNPAAAGGLNGGLTGPNQNVNAAALAAAQIAQQQQLQQQQQQQQSPFTPNVPPGYTPPGGTTQSSTDTSGTQGQSSPNTATGGGQTTAGATSQPGQSGSNNTIFGNTGVGGQTFGGGAIVGVASKSKDPTIRIFNKKKTYDEWQFIYSPMMEVSNTLLRGPYNGQTFTPSQIGTPAGQLNQQQSGNSGATGLNPQNSLQNQQQNQQLTPGNQFPPDQSQTPH